MTTLHIDADAVSPVAAGARHGRTDIVRAQLVKLLGHAGGQSCEVEERPRAQTHGEDGGRAGLTVRLVVLADRFAADGGAGLAVRVRDICAHEGLALERLTMRWLDGEGT